MVKGQKKMKRIMLLLFLIFVFSSFAYAECPSGMVSYWTFDDGTAVDTFGSNDGIISGDPAIVTGQVGQAFSLDSTNDNIDMGTDPSLDLGSTFTVSAWIPHIHICWYAIMMEQ